MSARELEDRVATPEPMPTTGQGQAVEPALIAYIRARTALGVKKYGVALATRNGRDATLDALQEALDLSQYLMQDLLEARGDVELARQNVEHLRATAQARDLLVSELRRDLAESQFLAHELAEELRKATAASKGVRHGR